MYNDFREPTVCGRVFNSGILSGGKLCVGVSNTHNDTIYEASIASNGMATIHKMTMDKTYTCDVNLCDMGLPKVQTTYNSICSFLDYMIHRLDKQLCKWNLMEDCNYV